MSMVILLLLLCPMLLLYSVIVNVVAAVLQIKRARTARDNVHNGLLSPSFLTFLWDSHTGHTSTD